MSKDFKDRFIEKKEKELTEFDILPLTLEKIWVTMNGDALALLCAEGKRFLFMLNNMEATMLTFVYSGCHNTSYVNTIYNLYLATLDNLKIKIDSATVEAKEGDVWYGRLCLIDAKSRKFYCRCTAADAIILALMKDTKLYIIRKVLDEVDSFDDDNPEEMMMNEE